MKRREFLKSSIVAGTAGVLLDACTPPGSELARGFMFPQWVVNDTIEVKVLDKWVESTKPDRPRG